MWQIVAALFALSPTFKSASVFNKEQIIFSSNFNITRILVPADGNHYILEDTTGIPSIFFTVSDPKLDGGSCIYVLEDLAAYEILEGGRDCTADYSSDRTVYLGARDGVYKYDFESFSAKKYGPFRDSIIQIQKANGTDRIYFLREDRKLLYLERNGTIKSMVNSVICATEFVLDTSNNIYYVQCGDKTIHIIRTDGTTIGITTSIVDDLEYIKLIRPAFVMEKSIPFLGNGVLYNLYANGTSEKKDLRIEENVSAISVDAALYFVAAFDGKIYEYNVMDVMLQSMFGVNPATTDFINIIMSVMDTAKDGIFGFYKGWYAAARLR